MTMLQGKGKISFPLGAEIRKKVGEELYGSLRSQYKHNVNHRLRNTHPKELPPGHLEICATLFPKMDSIHTITMVVPDTITTGDVKQRVLKESTLKFSSSSFDLTKWHLFLNTDKETTTKSELLPDESLLVQDHASPYHQSSKLPQQYSEPVGLLLLGEVVMEMDVIPSPYLLDAKNCDDESRCPSDQCRVIDSIFDASSPVAQGSRLSIHTPPTRSFCSVLHFKQRIHDHFGDTINIGIERLHFQWKGQELSNDVVLDPLQHPSLSIWISEATIYVRTLKGRTFAFGVDLDGNTLSNLKESIHSTIGVPVHEQHLVTADGVHLNGSGERNDDTTLKKCGVVENGCTLFLVLKQDAEQATLLLEAKEPGCRIEEPEYRGITLAQLRIVATLIITRCVSLDWKSVNPEHSNKRLRPNDVTLYDLMHNFIQPVTGGHQCSYVELVSSTEERQTPYYFCSHWWGENVLNFVACLEQHSFDRNLNEHTPYWVCAYAINQHNVSKEILQVDDPKMSPFYRAMHLTQGAVSILDKDSVCFSRIWCAFEVAIVMNDMKVQYPTDNVHALGYTYDIYSSRHDIGDIPVGITDGFCAADLYPCAGETLDLNNPRNADERNRAKSKRQASFPLETCRKSLALQLEKGNATCQDDKKFVLNCITNNSDKLGEPPVSHEAYDRLNGTLRGKFVESLYRTVLENDTSGNMAEFRKVLSLAPFSTLTMSFEECAPFLDDAKLFARALPCSLIHLELDFSKIGFIAASDFAGGLGQLLMLESLQLNLSRCIGLTNLDLLGDEIGQLILLKELVLKFTHCSSLQSINGLGRGFSNLTELSRLSLDAMGCKLACLDYFSENLALLKRLRYLELKLCCPSLSSVDSLGRAVSHLANIEEFSWIADCWRIESLTGLFLGLRETPKLSKLQLDVKPLSFHGVGDGVCGLSQLEVLELSCRECSTLSSIKDVSTGLLGIKNLAILSLSFVSCPNLTSLSGLRQALCGMVSLKELKLSCFGCAGLLDINDVKDSLKSTYFGSLELLWLDFSAGPGLSFSKLCCDDLALFSGATMPLLKSLQVHFGNCPHIVSVQNFVDGFKTMNGRRLRLLDLDFRGTSAPKASFLELCNTIVAQDIDIVNLCLKFSVGLAIFSKPELLRLVLEHSLHLNKSGYQSAGTSRAVCPSESCDAPAPAANISATVTTFGNFASQTGTEARRGLDTPRAVPWFRRAHYSSNN